MTEFASRLPKRLYQQVTRDITHHFPGPHKVRRDEVLVDRNWCLQLDDTCGPLTRLAAKDLRRTLLKTFDVKLQRSGRRIQVTVDPNATRPDESSRLSVSREQIHIEANSDEAAMRALFDLRWCMLNRQAPVLACGDSGLSPEWSLRIMSPVWHRPIDQPEDYTVLPDAYLLNAARYGFNATYLYADWFDFMTPDVAGALARKGYRARLAALRDAVAHLGRFGIRLLMHINTIAMSHDHPFFKTAPAMRGAQTWRDGQHCLCSSHPKTLALYRQAARQLMSDVPGLAGAVMITGGECFLHCYTRPMPQTSQGTNCKRCAKHTPDDVIARVVNAFAAGAREVNPDVHLMMWPYSAFTWGDLDTQKRFIGNLDPHVDLLSSFEKDSFQTIDGVKSYVFDYSICQLGPSPRFRELHRTAKRAGRKVHARTESAQCIEMFNVPRIPIMHRWAERFAAIRKIGVDGVHTAWRFYGFCAQRNDEIVYANTWRDNPDIDDLLLTMARRDFGGRAARNVVRAWEHFSKGFAEFPYCAGTTGFPYFRGPFYIGPAHPFVFDTTRGHGLPEMFWTPNPSAGEAASPDESSDVFENEPRFFADLTWTQPYGAKRVAGALASVDKHWRKGLALLQRAGSTAKGGEFESELAVATMIHCMFRTARNLVAFQMLREKVTTEPTTPASVKRACLEAIKVVTDETENARIALELVKADPSLGYGAAYGYAFTADMIEAKIKHCQHQIDIAIPGFYDIHAFHCFGVTDRSLGPNAS